MIEKTGQVIMDGMTDKELLAIATRVMDTEGESDVCDSLLIFRALADYAYAKGAFDTYDETRQIIVDWFRYPSDEFKWSSQLIDVLAIWMHSRGIERPE